MTAGTEPALTASEWLSGINRGEQTAAHTHSMYWLSCALLLINIDQFENKDVNLTPVRHPVFGDGMCWKLFVLWYIFKDPLKITSMFKWIIQWLSITQMQTLIDRETRRKLVWNLPCRVALSVERWRVCIKMWPFCQWIKPWSFLPWRIKSKNPTSYYCVRSHHYVSATVSHKGQFRRWEDLHMFLPTFCKQTRS